MKQSVNNRMWTSVRIQYLLATVIGLSALAWQAYFYIAHFGLDDPNSKHGVMVNQFLNASLEAPETALTLLAYALLACAAHLALTFGAVGIYRQAMHLASPPQKNSITRSTAFALAAMLLAVLWNRALHPYSNAFRSSELLLVQPASPFLFWGLTALVTALGVLAILSLSIRYRRLMTLLACTIIALTTWNLALKPADAVAHANREQPDIIIIGIDSLRPDQLSHTRTDNVNFMPALNSTLDQMVIFEDTTTPLARTFVSYMSVLSGQHPVHHGARFNLYPRSEFSTELFLPSALKQHGYETMLAMDESRFANFDESFGFDHLIVPSVGALDFLVGSVYDLVATNLLLAVPTVNGLMPHVHANRAAYRTYRWHDHADRFSRALRRTTFDNPLFIVHHLCLPHWPYLPLTIHGEDGRTPRTGLAEEDAALLPYRRSLQVADRQFQDAMKELSQTGRLDNAILIVLSDHGEAFAISTDAINFIEGEVERKVFFYGHGTSTISPEQSRVLFAMQRYIDGKPTWRPRVVEGPASLLDIAPTVAELVTLPTSPDFDGISLLPALNGAQSVLDTRTRFIETGIRSPGVERVEIDERQVAEEMSYLYVITPDFRFEIDPNLLRLKIRQKQRAATRENLILAAIPADHRRVEPGGCWVVLDTDARSASCISVSSSDHIVAALYNEVCNFYSSDQHFHREWCRSSDMGKQ